MSMQFSTASLLFIRAIQCFNVAAFVSLSFFYFAMFCIGSLTAEQLILQPPHIHMHEVGHDDADRK